MNIKYISAIFVLLIAAIFVVFTYVELPYKINTRGIVYPSKEWQIIKTDDGSLLNVLKNNHNNTISYYSVTEFQRGDFAEFVLNEVIFGKEKIFKGDTIGYIKSNEEQRRYNELKGELAARESLLKVYSTGAKPEEIAVAYENMMLAKQEYETQKKITERNKILHEDNYISDEEYELSFNSYKTLLYSYNIAKSEYNAVTTGAKKEQIDYIKASIQSLKIQISDIENLINSFTLLSPFTGIIIKQHGNNSEENAVISLADISNFIVILPVELYQVEYLQTGQNVYLRTNSNRQPINAKIIDIDNSVQMINFRQKIFVTAKIINDENSKNVIPNMLVDVEIDCGKLPAKEYFKRLLQTVYQN